MKGPRLFDLDCAEFVVNFVRDYLDLIEEWESAEYVWILFKVIGIQLKMFYSFVIKVGCILLLEAAPDFRLNSRHLFLLCDTLIILYGMQYFRYVIDKYLIQGF